MSSKNDTTSDASSVPRAVIHKKILEAAEAAPDASIEALADKVSGASPSLVERVLDEYGDPNSTTAPGPDDIDADPAGDQDAAGESDAADDTEPDSEQAHATQATTKQEGAAADAGTDLDDLTERQLDILDAIRRRPEATQGDLASSLDVSQATVSKHLGDVDGFDWDDRQSFVDALPLADDAETSHADDAEAADSEPDQPQRGDATPDAPTARDAPMATRTVAATDDDAESPEPEPDPPATADPSATPSPTDAGDTHPDMPNERSNDVEALTAAVDDVTDRLDRLDDQLADRLAPNTDDAPSTPTLDDPELVAKVIRATVRSDTIDEAEEIAVIKALTHQDAD